MTRPAPISPPTSATVRSHAADQLLELLAGPSVSALVSACASKSLDEAYGHFLGAIARVRDSRAVRR